MHLQQTLEPVSRLLIRTLSSASSSSCWTSHPGLQLLNLLLASFHGNLLRFIQTVLQVFDSLLHVLLHAFQVSAGVLLFLQLLCHHGRISNGLLGLILTLQGVDGPLQFPFHLRLNLSELKLSSQDFPFLMLKRSLRQILRVCQKHFIFLFEVSSQSYPI
uniref:Uncharacterized protein n=1 Tax=Takifugu rubripes TaxID=31033 RepID=A0A674PJ47_TAKRU